jgi:hypothetical protein
MALHDMSIEPAIELHASFEVYHTSGDPIAEVRFAKGFFNGSNPVFPGPDLFYRQANAVVAEALIGFKFCKKGRFYPECLVGSAADYLADDAGIFDDACKHGSNFVF